MKEEKALRYNNDKRKWSLVPFKALEPMVEVLEYGLKKYSRDNWRAGEGLNRIEILESMQRHLGAAFDGEEKDKESGLYHIAHIMTNCMFWIYFKQKEEEDDDKKTDR